jgi:rhamnosyltransferase subunit B
MANIALVAFGSAGDVHPMLAVGQYLGRRGHRVAMLTNPYFADQVAQAGLEFMPVGEQGHYEQTVNHPKVWDAIDGMGVMWRYLLRPALAPTVDALFELHRRARWLVFAGPVAMGARLAQEKYGLSMVSTYTAATMFRTVEDPMTMAKWRVSPRIPRAARHLAWQGLDRFKLGPLVRPALDELRARLGLPPLQQSVFGEWMHSPEAGVTLFAPWFAPRKSDWPAQVVEGGFPLFDADSSAAATPELEAFVADGTPPVVFMHGTAAMDEADFFTAAVRACAATGTRGILLGRVPGRIAHSGVSGIHTQTYAPFGWLLPRARALVHHGGVGSCAQALRAGIPQLIAPRAYDQFDNAMRVESLGVGLMLGTGPAALQRMGQCLGQLLVNPRIARACADQAARVSPASCHEAIDGLLARLA